MRDGKWMPIFRDREHWILLLNLETGAVREAPWILLRTDDGHVFFANLFTRETRWFPPHRWMQEWVTRSFVPSNYRAHGAVGCHYLPLGSPLLRHMLDPYIARLRVEGGAPYLHERGVPQYAPDVYDTLETYPELSQAHRDQRHAAGIGTTADSDPLRPGAPMHA